MSNLFAERFRRARLASGLKAKEIADIMEVSAGYVSQIEAGKKSNVSKDCLLRASKGLGVSVEYLLKGEGTEPAFEQRRKIGYLDKCPRCEELERQLYVAQETINNLSKALAQGRAVAAPASGACGGGLNAAPSKRERRVGT